jgi:putative RNA 2'-phosphotransferase
MDPKQFVRISKYLSKHLRHEPEALGLELAPGGWVSVEHLLTAAAERHGVYISRDALSEVVANNDKKRFSFDETGRLIRANQGHSAEVDLGLEPVEPPALLYHGTGETSLPAILRDGLMKMARHHVHLSGDEATARTVGRRHGKPVVLEIDAAAMRRDGLLFYRSANGVWLVDHVPPIYLRPL